VFHKPYNTLRSQIVRPKDPTPDTQKCGVVYEIACNDCADKYIGETAQAYGTRLKEHLRKTGSHSAVAEHITNKGHTANEQDSKVGAREDKFWRRKIHEAIVIRDTCQKMNRDQGLQLPPVYNKILSCDLTRPRDREA
jgi:hypothetical protein